MAHMGKALAVKHFWFALLSVAAFCSCSCSSTGPPDSSLPEPGKELSTVPGVSIQRRPTSLVYNSTLNGNGEWSRVEATDALLFEIFCKFCPFDGPIYDDAPLPGGRYDVIADAGRQGEPVWPLLKEAIEKAFGVQVRQITQPEDVNVLKRRAGKSITMTRAAPDARFGWGTHDTAGGFGYRLKSSSMDDLVPILEKYTETKVFNETALEGRFDFDLAMDHWHPETVYGAVEQLGLELVKETRNLGVIRIQKVPDKEAPAPPEKY